MVSLTNFIEVSKSQKVGLIIALLNKTYFYSRISSNIGRPILVVAPPINVSIYLISLQKIRCSKKSYFRDRSRDLYWSDQLLIYLHANTFLCEIKLPF